MTKKAPAISIRFVMGNAAVAYIVALGIACLTPIAFSGYRADQSVTRFWLLLSDSGAQWGVGSVMLLAAALIAAKHVGFKKKIRYSGMFLIGVAIVLAVIALTNEFVTKPLVAAHRPYVLRLEKERLLSSKAFYALPTKSERSALLLQTFESNQSHPFVRSIDLHVKKHWTVETGFSFPSGHSLNAFLFAVLLGFLVQYLLPKGKFLVWLPFLWAIGISLSRVAVGAHSPLDISIGALCGAMIGGLLLKSGYFNPLITLADTQDGFQ